SDALPVLDSQFGEWLVRPDRGIVDQDVDTAELGQRLIRPRFGLTHIGDIGTDLERLYPALSRFAHHSVGLGLIGASVDDNMGTLRGQLQHRRAADVAARTRYQRDFSVEL